ncbi:hypothetical protein NC652_013237 [Populus alba x Populus x berolinensis]|nr:hypothetical protein NC652_013237 [Populus alba x Populus x berolinensis]
MIFEEKVVAFEEHGQVGMCNLSCRTSTLLMMGFGSSEMCDHVADGTRVYIAAFCVLEIFDKYALFPSQYDSMDAVMRRVFNTEPVAQLLDIGKLFQQS